METEQRLSDGEGKLRMRFRVKNKHFCTVTVRLSHGRGHLDVSYNICNEFQSLSLGRKMNKKVQRMQLKRTIHLYVRCHLSREK